VAVCGRRALLIHGKVTCGDVATEGGEAEEAVGMCGARGVRSSKVTSTKTSVFNAEGGVTQLIRHGV